MVRNEWRNHPMPKGPTTATAAWQRTHATRRHGSLCQPSERSRRLVRPVVCRHEAIAGSRHGGNGAGISILPAPVTGSRRSSVSRFKTCKWLKLPALRLCRAGPPFFASSPRLNRAIAARSSSDAKRNGRCFAHPPAESYHGDLHWQNGYSRHPASKARQSVDRSWTPWAKLLFTASPTINFAAARNLAIPATNDQLGPLGRYILTDLYVPNAKLQRLKAWACKLRTDKPSRLGASQRHSA
ncbi:hypothetical protein CPLU01_15686 [Colletotrichum plurivorum]|uniref:Uncharacterized protein n=1 Tax=Colletotrichum plurivorum TaxID=2175906 RepID=A0A8H6MTA4_9PEZI|nr:hypothetical protein CPLU01_15686 [Colletotrichum plurivorum]